jgi:serine/threonine-protein kinase
MPDWTALRSALLVEQPELSLPPSVKLPILPQALTEFTQLAKDPDADVQELGRIIATDSGLTSELLRHANSAAVGARTRITSVQHALTLFGIRKTQLILTTSGLKNTMRSTSSKLINLQNFWNTNLERALLAREVAQLIDADADLAFTAGMLQDILLPAITNELFEDYLEFAENREKFTDLASFEQQRFGWNHAQAAAQVMLVWNLPDELICCVYSHHKGTSPLSDEEFKNASLAAVAVSCLLPDPLRQEVHGLAQLIDLDKNWDDFELLPIAKRIDAEFSEIASDTRNHIPFLRICQKALSGQTTHCEPVSVGTTSQFALQR